MSAIFRFKHGGSSETDFETESNPFQDTVETGYFLTKTTFKQFIPLVVYLCVLPIGIFTASRMRKFPTVEYDNVGIIIIVCRYKGLIEYV